jgi:hypothetical protein
MLKRQILFFFLAVTHIDIEQIKDISVMVIILITDGIDLDNNLTVGVLLHSQQDVKYLMLQNIVCSILPGSSYSSV